MVLLVSFVIKCYFKRELITETLSFYLEQLHFIRADIYVLQTLINIF